MSSRRALWIITNEYVTLIGIAFVISLPIVFYYKRRAF
jgi:hypothetical protein